MKKRLLTCLTVLTLSMASSMSVLAAPEIMPDGGVFDAEYYAKNNPDVVAVLGTDKDALYSHFVNNGKAEGRLGTAPVELTKDSVVTRCDKRTQLCATRNNYEPVYDKVGHYFDTNLDLYFSDAALEQFATYDDLIKFVESVDVYKYADEVTFANSYYYQDLKTKSAEYALAHLNDDYFQYHYQTREHYFVTSEGQTCLSYIYNLVKPYYGENVCGAGWAGGLHWVTKPDEFHALSGESDGYCVGVAIYRNEDLKNMYFDKWKATVR